MTEKIKITNVQSTLGEYVERIGTGSDSTRITVNLEKFLSRADRKSIEQLIHDGRKVKITIEEL